MKKSILLFLMLLAVGLAGCLTQVQGTPPSTSTSIATKEAKPAPTVVLTIPTQSAFLPDPGCTVITIKPTVGPAEESIYPPVSESDHVKGPDNAKVTISEYSD